MYFIFNTEETPTKYMYGCKYAAYNKFLGNFSLTRLFHLHFPDFY